MTARHHQYQLAGAPRPLSRRHVRLDNIALVPASLLPYRRQWQRIANELPSGAILVCVPTQQNESRQPFLAVARDLRAKGFRVRAVKAESVSLRKEVMGK